MARVVYRPDRSAAATPAVSRSSGTAWVSSWVEIVDSESAPSPAAVCTAAAATAATGTRPRLPVSLPAAGSRPFEPSVSPRRSDLR